MVGGIWIRFGGFFTIIKPLSGTALSVTCVFLIVWRIFMGASPIIAMTLKYSKNSDANTISLRYLCRNTKHRADFPRHLKRSVMDSRFLASSQISGRCTIALFQLSLWCENCVAARHYAVIFKQLLKANDRNRVCWIVSGLPRDGACTDLLENFSETYRMLLLSTPLFSHWSIPLR